MLKQNFALLLLPLWGVGHLDSKLHFILWLVNRWKEDGDQRLTKRTAPGITTNLLYSSVHILIFGCQVNVLECLCRYCRSMHVHRPVKCMPMHVCSFSTGTMVKESQLSPAGCSETEQADCQTNWKHWSCSEHVIFCMYLLLSLCFVPSLVYLLCFIYFKKGHLGTGNAN